MAPYFLNRANKHVICKRRDGCWIMAPYLGCVKKTYLSNAGIRAQILSAPCPIDPIIVWLDAANTSREGIPVLPSLKVSVISATEAEREETQRAKRFQIAAKKFRAVFFTGRNDKHTGKAVHMSGFEGEIKDCNGVYNPLLVDEPVKAVCFYNLISKYFLRTFVYFYFFFIVFVFGVFAHPAINTHTIKRRSTSVRLLDYHSPCEERLRIR